MKRRLADLFVGNFWAAFLALLLVKLGLVVNNIWGTEGFEPPQRLLPKTLLFLGWDVVGALIAAGVVWLACVPLVVWLKGRFTTALSVPVQMTHGLLASVSLFTTVFVGGPLNKQAIDAGILEQAGEVKDWLPAVWESVTDFASPGPLAFMGFVMLLAGLAVPFGPRVIRAAGRRGKRVGLAALAAAVVVTLGLLPWLQDGYFWGFRMKTYDMEYSPTVELAWSYVKPVLRSFEAKRSVQGDEFRFDTSSPTRTATLPAQVPAAHPARTNVLLVIMESVGEEYLDRPENPMPYLSSLRSRPGVASLDSHYTSWALTTTAIFSLLCAELPYPTPRTITLINPAIPCKSLSEALHDAGYFTAFVTSQDFAFDRLMRFIRHRKFDLLWDMYTMPGADLAWKGRWGLDDRVTVKNVLELASERRPMPFFLVYGMFAGHHPYVALPEHSEYDPDEEGGREKAYLRALAVADQRVKDLLEGFERLGLLEDTLVVIVSDHGEGQGRRAGRNVYDVVVRVPALVMGPQLPRQNLRIRATTSHIDLAPTILGLLGLEPPCTMKGRDLTRPSQERVALFGGRPPKFQLGLADGNWKFILEDFERTILYDLSNDPEEADDVAHDHPDMVERYRLLLEDFAVHSENLLERYADILTASGCRP
jgi:hypothetical protein